MANVVTVNCDNPRDHCNIQWTIYRPLEKRGRGTGSIKRFHWLIKPLICNSDSQCYSLMAAIKDHKIQCSFFLFYCFRLHFSIKSNKEQRFNFQLLTFLLSGWRCKNCFRLSKGFTFCKRKWIFFMDFAVYTNGKLRYWYGLR